MLRIYSEVPANSLIMPTRDMPSNVTGVPAADQRATDNDDWATLCNTDQTAQMLESKLKDLDDSRPKLLDSLRSTIGNGTYQVSARQVAVAMLKSLKSL